jgi:hypothetical protein
MIPSEVLAAWISDVIDAREAAHRSSDPFWITVVVKRLARASNGLMIFTPRRVRTLTAELQAKTGIEGQPAVLRH